MIYEILGKILRKTWTPESIHHILGQHERSYLAYSSDESIRTYAASGGVCTAILLHALEQGIIDGAITCQTLVGNGRVDTKFTIVTNRQELLASQGSKYIATRFIVQATPLIKNFSGKLAVVGLPCDIAYIRRWGQRDSAINEKIRFTIALLCGHNSQPRLISHIIESLEKEAASSLTKFYFRIGHWRGTLRAEFENGAYLEKPSSYFNLYQNLYFFADKKCLYCSDHFGYDADISLGDVWAIQLKKLPIKHSGVITRTSSGEKLFEACLTSGAIKASPVEIALIMDGQARSAPWHYNISARHKAGKIFNLLIPDKVHATVKWHEYLATLIILFNWMWSQHARWSPLIFKIPRIFLKLYLYFLTALRSLQ